MCEVIDFPTDRIKRVIFLQVPRMAARDHEEVFAIVADRLEDGLSARAAVADALARLPWA